MVYDISGQVSDLRMKGSITNQEYYSLLDAIEMYTKLERKRWDLLEKLDEQEISQEEYRSEIQNLMKEQNEARVHPKFYLINVADFNAQLAKEYNQRNLERQKKKLAEQQHRFETRSHHDSDLSGELERMREQEMQVFTDANQQQVQRLQEQQSQQEKKLAQEVENESSTSKNTFKNGMKSAGSGVVSAGKYAGNGLKSAAKGTHKGLKWLGRSARISGKTGYYLLKGNGGGKGNFISFLFLIAIFILGPLMWGVISIGGIIDVNPYTMIFLFAVIIIVAMAAHFQWITDKHWKTILMFGLFNIFAPFVLEYAGQVSPNSKGILFVLYGIIGFLLILYNFDWIGVSGMVQFFFVIILLLFAVPFLWGIFENPSAINDHAEQTQTQTESAIRDTNILGSFMDWFTLKKMQANGTYIEGQQEVVFQARRVRMEEPFPARSSFYQYTPVIIEVEYTGNPAKPVKVATTCRIGNSVVPGDPSIVYVTETSFPRVRCTFPELPAGSYEVFVTGTYTYQSTVRVPFKVMTSDLDELFRIYNRDSNSLLNIERILGRQEKAITSLGPITIGVSNTKINGQEVLQQPLIINPSQPNLYPPVFKFQLQQVATQPEGKEIIQGIRRTYFNVPEGLELFNCNFMDSKEPLPYTVDGQRWIIDVSDMFMQWTPYTTLTCSLLFHNEYLQSFIPETVKWSRHTLLLSVDYDYSMERNIQIRVES